MPRIKNRINKWRKKIRKEKSEENTGLSLNWYGVNHITTEINLTARTKFNSYRFIYINKRNYKKKKRIRTLVYRKERNNEKRGERNQAWGWERVEGKVGARLLVSLHRLSLSISPSLVSIGWHSCQPASQSPLLASSRW